MKVSRIFSILVTVMVLAANISTAQANNRVVFKGKAKNQHELTNWEQKKMNAEFQNKFSTQKSGAFQKLNKNPWAAKKAREDAHQNKMLKMSATWGTCREYAYKQRGQCYARGGDAYTCERYYDARTRHCDAQF